MLNHRSRSTDPRSSSEPRLHVIHLESLNDDSYLARLRSNFSHFLASRPLRNLFAHRAHQFAGPSGIWSDNSWRQDPQFARVEALSVAIHVTILVLLIAPLLPRVVMPGTAKRPYFLTAPHDLVALLKGLKPTKAITYEKKPKGGGGGGDHNPLQEGTGALAIFKQIQLAPPSIKPPANPAYPVQPTILGPEELKILSPEINHWGNPVSPVVNDSNGPGSSNGIGSGKGHGVGDGDGDGLWHGHQQGVGGDYPVSGINGYREVACVYCPSAQFSDEAVKAKFEGTVLLSLIVTTEGRASDVRVVRGLGMGLDEQALNAVRNWRFRPSVGPNGQAAAVRAIVEVVFHLY